MGAHPGELLLLLPDFLLALGVVLTQVCPVDLFVAQQQGLGNEVDAFVT